MRLSPGTALGPYEISGPIGAGGMGEVYRARDTRLGREVALKVLPREVVGNAERLARFEREARSASALNHPNIVTIHDFAFAENDCYLVMELIRGQSLREVLSRGALPLRKLLAIAGGIADGLAAAHAAGIVHRDLKPENVMLTADGTPKLLDFGLVKAASAESNRDAPTEVRVTNSGTIVGTLTYMSPEQAQGQSVGIASDQFSLGLMLHEMATGTHPFLRATSYETATAIIREEPAPLSAALPEPFRWIVERCLAKDPSQRYASTADLAHDLNALRSRVNSTGAAVTVTTTPIATRRTALWRLRTIAAAATVLVIVALAVVALRGRGASANISTDPLHLHLSTGELQVSLGETAVPVSISPDGRHLVTQGTNRAGTGELWLTDLRTGDARLIAENGFGAAWSNDSKSIAFFADGKLKTIRADGGPARTVCEAPPEGTPSWYGETILFARYSGREEAGLFRVDAAGGLPERVVGGKTVKGQPHLAWWPQFLPGGKRFIYMSLIMTGDLGIEHELNVGSLDGSPAVRIGAIDSRAVFAAGHLLYVREGTLLAQPFDVESARFTGEARPLVEDVHYFRSTGHAAFSVSDNGILAWRSARRPSRLVWLDRSGIETASIAAGIFDGSGRLSRDGRRYAAGVLDPKQGTSDVWVYDLERDSSDRLTLDLLDQKAPVWTHDGQSLYYRTDGNKGPPDIFVLRSGERPALLYAGPSVEHPEDVSPDGKSLLITSHLAGSIDIQLLPLDPLGKPRPFVVTPMNEHSPRFSPDGRRVAYASNVSGRSEVYVRPFDGVAAGLRVSQSGGALPRWSGNGQELFFFGPAGRLLSVSIGATIGTPRMLFQAADALSFEVDPKGDRFLVELQERSGHPDVQLIVNWPAMLARE